MASSFGDTPIVPPTGQTATWASQLDRQGFAMLPFVFGEREVDKVLEELKKVPLLRSRAGMRHCLGIESVRRMALDARMLGVVRFVLGQLAIPFRATLFDKSSDANWLVVWHQDTGLPLKQHRVVAGWGPWSVKQGVNYAHAPASALSRVLALRIHLDQSTIANGPLRVLPETHRMGVLSDALIEKLAVQLAPSDCIARRGEVLAMRPLLVHSSSKAEAEASRRVLHIEYAASDKIEDGLELASV